MESFASASGTSVAAAGTTLSTSAGLIFKRGPRNLDAFRVIVFVDL